MEDIVSIEISIGTFGKDPSSSYHFLIQLRNSRNNNKVIIHKDLFNLWVGNQTIFFDENGWSSNIPFILIDSITVGSNDLQIIIEADSIHSKTIDVELDIELWSNIQSLVRSKSDLVDCFVIGENVDQVVGNLIVCYA